MANKLFKRGKSMADQKFMPLWEAIKEHGHKEVIPFHVPGHKYGKGIGELTAYLGDNALKADLNGMEDLDYYHNPKGVIWEAQKLFAQAFGAKDAFFLVNGTTGGIHTMLLSTCKPGDQVLVPRNIHRSALSAMILGDIRPIYIKPEIDSKLGIANGVSQESLTAAITANPQARAVFLINPTYYGVTVDLKAIVDLAHQAGLLVLVDEAHGTHMYFHPEFPPTAMESGADISTVSVHKTGGSLTQSSALLIGSNRINRGKVREAINLLATSSASYLLMGSLDVARRQLATAGKRLLADILRLSRWARREINKIDGLYAFGKEIIDNKGCCGFDETKLAINVKGLGYTGFEVERKLRKEYNIQIELADLYNILAIVSLGDRREELTALIDALKGMTKRARPDKALELSPYREYPTCIIPPRQAYFMAKRKVKLGDSIGLLSGETILAYPPGIPIICSGELITAEVIEYLKLLKSADCHLQGATDNSLIYIRVLNTD